MQLPYTQPGHELNIYPCFMQARRREAGKVLDVPVFRRAVEFARGMEAPDFKSLGQYLSRNPQQMPEHRAKNLAWLAWLGPRDASTDRFLDRLLTVRSNGTWPFGSRQFGRGKGPPSVTRFSVWLGR